MDNEESFKKGLSLIYNPKLNLIINSIMFIILIMFNIIMLWLYFPYGLWSKILLTIFSISIYYDVFKNFLYVKWILINEELEEE